MMDFVFELVVDGYRGGEKVTLDVAERDGYVVIGLSPLADPEGARGCLLEPAVAATVVQALEQAIARAKVKRES